MPGFPSPVCACGQARETAAHVIAHCSRFAEVRGRLADPHSGRLDVKALVSKAQGVQVLAKWVMQLHIMLQFYLAEKLLYSGDREEDGLEG